MWWKTSVIPPSNAKFHHIPVTFALRKLSNVENNYTKGPGNNDGLYKIKMVLDAGL